MALKQCFKCERMVEEAKAFCPYCSYSFDVEESHEASEFERSPETKSFTQSFFNEVLTDMNLNISDRPDARPPSEPNAKQVQQPRRSFTLVIVAGVILVIGIVAIVGLIILLYFLR